MKTCMMFLNIFLLLSLTIYSQDFEIKIDGEKDQFYNSLTGPGDGWIWLPPEAFNNNGPQPDDELDLSANYYSAWDDTYLYVYEKVSDDIVNQNNATWYQNDCIDIKVDADVDIANTGSIFSIVMSAMDSADVDESLIGGIRDLKEGWVTTEVPTSADYARVLTDDGYILEFRVKWEWIYTNEKGPIFPEVGGIYGFAIMNHDNDNTQRDGSVEWAANLVDAVWSDATNHGHIELLADHKIKYVAENYRDPSIVNPNPDMYNPPSTDVSKDKSIVKDFMLSQNYPNPFNPVTNISYTIPKLSEVKISVYDLLGNEVAILVDGLKQAGTYYTQFDGKNLSSGIYYYKLQSEGNLISRKMAFIK